MIETLHHAIDANVHGNHLVLTALQEAGAPPVKAIAAFQHIIETEETWLKRIRDEDSTSVVLWGPPDLARAAERLTALDTQWVAFRDGLTLDGMDRSFSYTRNQGDRFTSNLGQIVLHTLLHSAQYRGETMGLLSQAGFAVPDTDFIFYLRSIGA